MNKLKLQLYRHCPTLVGKSIGAMLKEYKSSKNNRDGYYEQNEEEITLLEQLLPHILTEEFFYYIYKRCHFQFNLSSYFPKALEDSQEFVDLVLKHDPFQAFYVPDHLLTSEHLKLVEEALKKEPNRLVYSENIPEKFSKSKIIFERCLRYFFRESTYYSDSSFYSFLDSYYNVPEFYKQILKKHSEGKYDVDFRATHEKHKFLYVDEIAQYVVKRNYKEIINVPVEKRDVAIEGIVQAIQEKKIYFDFDSRYPFYNYVGWFDILSNSEAIMNAIFELDNFEIHIDFIRKSDISMFDDEKLIKLFKYSEEKNSLVLPNNSFSSPKVLSLFLHNQNSQFFVYDNLSCFKSEAFDDENIDYIIEHTGELPSFLNSILNIIANDNKEMMAKMLNCYKRQLLAGKLLHEDDEKSVSFRNLFKTVLSISEEYETVFLEILDILKTQGVLKSYSFDDNLWNDENFVKKINDNGLIDVMVEDLFNNYNGNYYIYPSITNKNKNPIFIKKYIDKCIYYIKNNNADVVVNGLLYLLNFNNEQIYGEVAFDSLLEYLDILFEKKMISKELLPQVIWSSSKVLKSFLEKDYLEYFANFNTITFNSSDITDLLFKKVDYTEFFSKEKSNNKLDKAFDEIKIETVEEFNALFNRLRSSYNYSFALILIKKYRASGLEDENLNNLVSYYLDRVREDLSKKYGNKNYSDALVDKILSDVRNVFTLEFIESSSHLIVASNYVDVLSDNQKELINADYKFLYENVNKKHINEIIKNLVDNYGFERFSAFDLAMKMYVSIGYTRCRDLLNKSIDKSYGPVSKDILNKIFNNISLNDVTLQKQGNGYIPVENKVLINLLFGANYKDKTTPISIYLSGFAAFKEKRDAKIEEIKNNSGLTTDEKNRLIDEVSAEYADSCNQINDFVNNFATIYNEWDILEEEFYKEKNKSKLSIKLNVAYCNSAIKKIESNRKRPTLEFRDEPLLNSDVFDYVGYDNQFVSEPAKAPARAIELSRRMEKVEKKKFPNIELEKDGYTLFVYGPQDRNILSAGFRSGCCFRPRGNADNNGKDNSLLNYCVSTEYGGGVEIRNSKGETVMFSPLLRNGNTLMIHSIETKVSGNKEAMSAAHKLLVDFSEKVVSESHRLGDSIDFVFITDLHYLDTSYTKSNVPVNSKFYVYDGDNSFSGMYTNLSCNHMLLAKTEGFTESDIHYGAVDYSYEYPTIRYDNFPPVQFTQEELASILSLSKLENEITLKSNERFEAKKSKDSDKSYSLLLEIKDLKKEYLKLYKKLLDSKKFVDSYEQYKKITSLINSINEKLGIDIDYSISEVHYGLDWYLVITPDNKIIANCLPDGVSALKRALTDIKELRPQLVNEQEVENIVQGFRI